MCLRVNVYVWPKVSKPGGVRPCFILILIYHPLTLSQSITYSPDTDTSMRTHTHTHKYVHTASGTDPQMRPLTAHRLAWNLKEKNKQLSGAISDWNIHFLIFSYIINIYSH